MRTYYLAGLVAAVLMFPAAPAAAQAADERRFSIGVSAGVAPQFHGDYNFTATAWQVDVRFNTARYFAIGLFLEQWDKTQERAYGPLDIQGPSGVLGRVDRVTTRTEYTIRTVGWNLLGRARAGRVVVTGGGGVNYMAYKRDYSQTVEGCQSTAPGVCGSGVPNRFTNSAFGVQLQGGVDVDLTRWLAAMGQFRALFPVEDPGSGYASVTGGVRVSF